MFCSARQKVYYLKGRGLHYRLFNFFFSVKYTSINSRGEKKAQRYGRWHVACINNINGIFVMTVFLRRCVACRYAFEYCLHVCLTQLSLHSNTQTKRHCARDNWRVWCVLLHCTFAPIFRIFVSLQQYYINSLFAGALMLGVRCHPCWGDLCSSSFAS